MISRSEKETRLLGERLGNLLSKGSVITLKGDLASGKTTFTKGIGKALNIKEVINSPTFTILKIYHGDKNLYHVDAYRLENNDYDLGLDEYFDDGIMVIEWPEYYQNYLPKQYLEIEFEYIDEDTRKIEMIAHGEKYERILDLLEC